MGEMADLTLLNWDPDDPWEWFPRQPMTYAEFLDEERRARFGKWHTRDGRGVYPRDMDIRHLQNAVKWMHRKECIGHYENELRELWIARFERALAKKQLFPESRYPRR